MHLLKSSLRKSASSDVPPLRSAVAYFLHFEPEATSLLGGGVTNWLQIRTILDLRSQLPRDIPLLVQEHVSQFLPANRSSYMGRSSLLYRTLAQTPGVTLLNPGTIQRQDLGHMGGVATLTGSVGLEASMRGRPVLCLGSAWYRWATGLTVASVPELLESFSEADEMRAQRNRQVLSAYIREFTYPPPVPTSSHESPAAKTDLLSAVGRQLAGDS